MAVARFSLACTFQKKVDETMMLLEDVQMTRVFLCWVEPSEERPKPGWTSMNILERIVAGNKG